MVSAPDGRNIPVPVGGIGLYDGSNATIRDDADMQISINETGAYHVVINNADASNEEAKHLAGEFAGEAGISVLERAATAGVYRGIRHSF
jgi:hypothetical protein